MITTVLIAGATGTAGSAYARTLHEAGFRVRGTVSPHSDIQAVSTAGVVPVEADLLKQEDAARAVRGVDALVVALLGRGVKAVEQEWRMTKNVVDAAAEAGVRHIIYTSVYKADAPTGVPHFEVKAELEAYIRRTGLTYTVLRPATFMAGLRAPWLLDGIVKRGVLASPIALHTAISYIAPEDLGRFGLAALNDERLRNATLELGGPEPVTYADLLPILSERLGRKIRYEQVPIEVVEARLGAGMAAMIHYFNKHGFVVDMTPVQAQFALPLTSVRTYLEAVDWDRFTEALTA